MRLKTLAALLAGAFAGVATTASAGVIQASYKNYAAEVFGSDAVKLTAPTIGYSLAQPLTGSVANPNSFSITWTLGSGEWDMTVAPNAILLAPDNTTVKTASTLTQDATNKNVLTATFVVDRNFPVGSQIILGLNAVGNAIPLTDAPATVTKVGTALGAPAADSCNPTTASVGVTVKMTNAAGAEFETNFTQAPLNNTTPIVQSSVALNLAPVSSAATGFDTLPLAAATSNKEQSKVDVLAPSIGTKFADGTADVTAASAGSNQIVLGQLVLKDRSTLYDLDATNAYSVQNVIIGGAGVTNGAVEVGTLTMTVTGTFQGGSTIYLEPGDTGAAACTVPAPTAAANGAVVTPAAGASSATLTLSNAAAVGVLSAPGAGNFGGQRRVNICYVAAGGTKVIPVSQFKLTQGSLSKTAASGEATNQICAGDLYNLEANGVRIDVRNYVPKVAKDQSGWFSVVRIINTDDTQSASPTITALLADGTLGASTSLDGIVSVNGTKGPLKPREARYYVSDAIDTALNAVATTTKPSFSAADVGANARLRISAPTSSIRVQNYVFNPGNGNFVESSAAQGDDGPDYGRQADRDNK